MCENSLTEKNEKDQKPKIIQEFSAGAVIFYRDKTSERLYLLLHYHLKSDYWDFPRGNLELGEHSIEAAKREIREETSLTEKEIEFIPGFREAAKWFYVLQGAQRFKHVTYFLAETKKRDIKISEEHQGYEWLPFERALKLLTYNNAKQVLKKAEAFLNKAPLFTR